jgi:chemotaxis protein methyltransferase CheR
MTAMLRPDATLPALSPTEFARIAAIAFDEAGLSLPEAKRTMISSRLVRRLRATGQPDFASYLAMLQDPARAGERRHLVSALTTNVSHFFREAHHFRTLAADVLPALFDRARAGARVRIWSAGCSTGQEPYSIAMALLEALPEATDLDVRILATDIDDAVLETARAGTYAGRLMQGVDDARRRRFFTAGHDAFTVRDPLRQLVTFRRLNLVGDWPVRGSFDAIFCRNVVIYFDVRTQAALWPRFHRALAPGGVLFLGHSERLDPASAASFATAGITTWRRIDPAGAHPARPGVPC